METIEELRRRLFLKNQENEMLKEEIKVLREEIKRTNQAKNNRLSVINDI